MKNKLMAVLLSTVLFSNISVKASIADFAKQHPFHVVAPVVGLLGAGLFPIVLQYTDKKSSYKDITERIYLKKNKMNTAVGLLFLASIPAAAYFGVNCKNKPDTIIKMIMGAFALTVLNRAADYFGGDKKEVKEDAGKKDKTNVPDTNPNNKNKETT